MASKNYFLRFGSGNPASVSGLAPTFLVFVNEANGSTTAPAITEVGTRGIYTFSYDIMGQIAFVVDGATSGLANADRYIVGALDLSDRIEQYGNTMIAIGTTSVAIGTTIIGQIGTTSDAIGDSSTTPTTVYGFLKRARNWLEGQAIYTKSTGVLNTYDTTGATLLSSRTISDSVTTVDRD